eukprot:jgi/Astpho2/7201/Aster-01519
MSRLIILITTWRLVPALYTGSGQFSGLLEQVPWFTPNVSYCSWIGVTCCLTAGSSFLKQCSQGVQSISGLQLVAANLSGTLPVFQTSMQQPCIASVTKTAPQVDDIVLYNSSVSCFPRWLEAVANSSVEQYTSPGLQNVVLVPPSAVSFHGCYCQDSYVSQWSHSTGIWDMTCNLKPQPKRNSLVTLLSIAIPLGVLAFTVIVTTLVCWRFGSALGRQWEAMRVTMVMTDVEGSTQLWEQDSAAADEAIALHDSILRGMLPVYFGFEVTTEGDAFHLAFHDPIDAVGWALHVQQEVRDATGTIIFRGLRVRMAIHTGTASDLRVHSITKQVEYKGAVVELTETISHLPAGSQLLFSSATFEKLFGRLHEIRLPADLVNSQCTIQQMPSGKKGLPVLEGVLVDDVQESSPSASPIIQAVGLAPRRRWRLWPAHASRTPADASFTGVPRSVGLSFDVQRTSPSFASTNQAPLEPELLTNFTTQEDNGQVFVIDMGRWFYNDYEPDQRSAADAALPVVVGVHLLQVLPKSLAVRALHFPAFNVPNQVGPTFFDAPGAHAAMLPGQKTLSAPVVNVTIAFCGPSGYKELVGVAKEEGPAALAKFKSCVRTTLSVSNGYECQERDGLFMLAFADPADAVTLDWGEDVLTLLPTSERFNPVDGSLLFRGLSAKAGIFEGEMSKITPHTTSGMARYLRPV